MRTNPSPGEEAIHVRDGSSNILIEGNYIHTTGLTTPGYGEAIYIGSDKSFHQYYDPTISHVIIRDNIIGEKVKAEGIDVREGTHDVSAAWKRRIVEKRPNLTQFL